MTLAVALPGGADGRGETVLAVPGRSNTNASIAAAAQTVAITWVAAGTGRPDVYVAVSADAGRTFRRPVLASGPLGADVSGEQPPRLLLTPRPGRLPALTVVWTAKGMHGTRLLSARSDDGGRRFSPPAPVSGSDAPGNRGWESVAITSSGDAVAAWLDHRELASAPGEAHGAHHGEHHPAERDGVARAQLSKLWFGPVRGAGSARAVAAGVCYCCKTALAAGPGGRLFAAWRHVYPGNVRDIAFTASNDGGRTFAAPIRVSDDGWVLDGCPENGPAMAVDAAGQVHLVWPTLVVPAGASREQELALFYAVSRDGQRFTARQRIPSASVARHPQLALGPRGDLLVAWDEPAGGRRRIAIARGRLDANGVASFVRTTLDDRRSASYPVVAVTAEGPLVAWTSTSTTSRAEIRVARIGP
jgi:hypothetical protein